MKPDDGLASYNLAIAAKREQIIRMGLDMPTNPTEERWAKEGPKPPQELDTAKAEPGA